MNEYSDLEEGGGGGESAGDSVGSDAAGLMRLLEEARARELRLMADHENYRRRTERLFEEQAEQRKRAFIVDLLDILDDFDRALSHPCDAEALREGIGSIQLKIMELLSRHGIERIDPMGEAFDPEEHEAVAMIHDAELAGNTVAGVERVGWRAGKRLLRAARVVVVQEG